MSEVPVAPRILARSQHPISRRDVSENAVKVLYRLHNAGFKACLVGGSVRDLLLGRRPKDFDAATDARPNEIRRLFRNSRIIGRRFRLAHVFFKDGVVEVSTFRRDPDPGEQESPPGDLLITSDNTFGTPEEDAFRRDFTVNALFYSIADFTVIDYVGGIDDLEQRLIRVIGDPDVRFKEDPVRMLRACEFAARLDFGIESTTQEAIRRHKKDLERASPARLGEELIQLLRCGHAGPALQWLLDLGLLEEFLPEAYAMVTAGARGLGEFGRILPALDRRVKAAQPISDAALLAALVLPAVLLRRYDQEALDRRPMRRGAIEEMVRQATEPFIQRFALARTRSQELQHALTTFQDLGDPRWSPAERWRIARRPSFGDARALLEVMVEATRDGEAALAAWREVAQRAGEGKAAGAPTTALPPPEPAKRGGRPARRRRRRRRGAALPEAGGAA